MNREAFTSSQKQRIAILTLATLIIQAVKIPTLIVY